MQNLDLTGRTALVTGSTQGIGLAIAIDLASAGARVVVNGRGDDGVQRAITAVRSAVPDADVTGVAADLATEEGAATVLDAFPHVDVLVNNLGIFGSRDPFEITDDEWRRYFEVNVLASIRLIRGYLPGMTGHGYGRVISIASDSAVVIPAEMIHYGMSKTALLAVSRGFAKAVKGTGVTVNTVIAGPTHTGGVEDFVAGLVGTDLPWDQAQRKFMQEHRPQSLVERLLEPEEIAHMVTYLASPLASATTGGALRADGGYVDSILP
jgi:NAD(P)-dependent dehydrogenase (short-subunit alcohol dehydrogenase family)